MWIYSYFRTFQTDSCWLSPKPLELARLSVSATIGRFILSLFPRMWVSKLVPSGLFGSSMNDNHGTIVPHYCRIRVTEKCLNCSSTTHSLSDNDRSCAPATARREIPRRLWGRRQSMYQRNSLHHVTVKRGSTCAPLSPVYFWQLLTESANAPSLWKIFSSRKIATWKE